MQRDIGWRGENPLTAIPRDWLTAVLRCPFVGLLSALLAACGGGGGDGDGGTCTINPPPRLDGTPPVYATVGAQYQASFDASYSCFLIFTCDAVDVLEAPAGAAASHDFVYWTPSADQVNKSFRFAIATPSDICGNRLSRSWTVAVFPPPVIQSFSADRTTVLVGENVSLTAVFEGNGFIAGVGPVVSGVPVMTGGITQNTSFVLTVSNAVGMSISQPLFVYVLGPPTILAFGASPATIPAGNTSLLSWSLSGDIKKVTLDPAGLDVTSLSQAIVQPSTTTTYTLTVTGTSSSTSGSVQVTVLPPPAAPAKIDSFAAIPPSSVPLGVVSLAVQFSGQNGRIEQELNGTYTLVATVNSGDVVSTGQLFRSTRYRLTVENADGIATTQELLVPLLGPGTFQPSTGQPIVPGRSYHSATRLSDGRVFISGGVSAGNSTELFDPVTETYSPGPNLLGERRTHSSLLLQDGRVLIAGGLCSIGVFNCPTTEIFDPSTNTITPGPDIAVAVTTCCVHRTVPLALLPDGRVLIGTFQFGSPSTYGVLLFDPADGTLSSLIPYVVPWAQAEVAQPLIDGRVFMFRGSSSEIFDPASNSFSQTGSPTATRSSAGVAILADGRVLIAGGTVLEGTSAEVYDPGSNTFTAVGGQQIAVGFGAYPNQTATRLENATVLVVGGNDMPFAELFDPATGAFKVTGGLRTGRDVYGGSIRTHTATLLGDGRVLVVGGCQGLPCEAELYTP